MDHIWTIHNAMFFCAGYVFANAFPFPDQYWKKIQTPVGFVLLACVAWNVFTMHR